MIKQIIADLEKLKQDEFVFCLYFLSKSAKVPTLHPSGIIPNSLSTNRSSL